MKMFLYIFVLSVTGEYYKISHTYPWMGYVIEHFTNLVKSHHDTWSLYNDLTI